MSGPDHGTLGRLPYLALGSGPPLLYLAGLSPVAGIGSSGRVEAASMRPFAGARRVLYLNRRTGLPRGMTMAELAAEHADGIGASFPGEPVDVLGASTGGSIAQQLAADHPDVVRRLVLLSTGCRLGPAAAELQRRVAARVRAGAPRRAMALFAADLVPPGPLQLPAALLGAAIGSLDLDDMATTIEAEDGFDLARLPPIGAPTLIVAGARDRFYPRALVEETARLIPGSRLEVVPGRGHISVLWSRPATTGAAAFLDGSKVGP